MPASVDGIDLPIVMGGAQQPSTTTEQYPYFDAGAENALIAACIKADKASSGSAWTPSSPERHKALFLAGFGGAVDTGNWHNNMPGLTRRGHRAGHRRGLPRQIVAYRRYVYGFQRHMEFTLACTEMNAKLMTFLDRLAADYAGR
ncbi:hypothetical protein AB0D11_35820 [Streptomyces monashensis]|uniref:hypothetical protein n=1 Tax=Streptomyces monashensis TaxID=1678012 RepID=UPI0033FD9F76